MFPNHIYGTRTIGRWPVVWQSQPMGQFSPEQYVSTKPVAADSDHEESGFGHAMNFAGNGVLRPLINSAFVEPINTVSETVNRTSEAVGGGKLLGQIHSMDYKPAEAYSGEWFAQNISAGLGALIPYTIAGKAAGTVMRGAGARFAVSGELASVLQSEKAAFVAGAFAYDGLKPLHDGETHFGNAAGGAAAFYVFGKGNEWSKGLSPTGQFAARAATGFAGADAHAFVSKAISQHDVPTWEELAQAGVSGATMNVVLPVVQDYGTRKLTDLQVRTPFGAPVDRYLSTRYGESKITPEVRALLEDNPWARVRISDYGDFNAKRNMIDVSKVQETQGAVAKGLEQIREARASNFETEFNQAATQLRSGNAEEAYQQFRSVRATQELNAHQAENVVDSSLGLTQRLVPENMAKELAAWPAPGGVSYEARWRQEFQQFSDSDGKWRPGDRVRATEEQRVVSDHPAEVAAGLVRDLQKAGFLAVFAGGSVRDEVMGGKPKDYDIATRATPDQVENLFESKGYKTILTGKQFGVINVVVGDTQYEIATLRTDGNYSDGRRPDGVQYVNSLYEDAARRDLTINAMFKDPTTSQVFDFFGGKQDIANKIIRTVGDPAQRFAEDRLRMMRVPRFASRYEGFEVAPETKEAVAQHASEVNSVSVERIREEMKGILTSKHPLTGLDFMMETGLMRAVLPEVAELTGPKAMQDPTWHPEGLTWTHTRMVLGNLVGSRWETMLGGLLHDIGKPGTQQILPDGKITNYAHAELGADMARDMVNRWNMSTAEKDHVVKLVADHMKMHTVQDWRRARLVELLGSKYFEDQVALQHADSVGTGRTDGLSKSQRDWLQEQHSQYNPVSDAKPLIVGKQLIDLGIKPGKRLGEIKDQAFDAQREGEFSDMASALNWLRTTFPTEIKPQ
jgi:poly(A) polymerase